MKKVQKNKKLSLGKMTVAKLRLNEHQMQRIIGGEDVTSQKPPNSKNDTIVDPCVLTTPRTNGLI